jgi:hypothetical protein
MASHTISTPVAYPNQYPDEHPSNTATYPTDRTAQPAPLTSGNPMHDGTTHHVSPLSENHRTTPTRSSSDSITRHKQVDPPAFTSDRKDAFVDEKGLGVQGREDGSSREREEEAKPKWKVLLKKYMWVVNTFLMAVMTG